eukprot:1205395-Pleurochrysis_carterae.AAC.2
MRVEALCYMTHAEQRQAGGRRTGRGELPERLAEVRAWSRWGADNLCMCVPCIRTRALARSLRIARLSSSGQRRFCEPWFHCERETSPLVIRYRICSPSLFIRHGGQQLLSAQRRSGLNG